MLTINLLKKIKTTPTYKINGKLSNETLSLGNTNTEYNLNSLKHYPPSIQEWNNSIYSFHKNDYTKLLPAIDKSIYRLMNAYFNLNPSINNKATKTIKRKFQKLSMIRLFISKPTMKHNNNKIIITVYTYNRKKLYFLNKIKKIFNIYRSKNINDNKLRNTKSMKKSLKLNRYSLKLLKRNLKKKTNLLTNVISSKSIFTLFMFLYRNSFLRKTYDTTLFDTEFNGQQNLKDVNNMIQIKRNMSPVNIFNFKHFCSMLYFNSYIFNSNNLLALKDILKKVYNKKVELNIINLKYLYLDSNIFAEAITRKLIDRKKRVLRILKLGLKLTKQPYFKLHFHRENIQFNHMFLDVEATKSLHASMNSISVWNNNLANNTELTQVPTIKNKYMFKPTFYNLRLFLYHMKQKIINGVRLQGTGRLTKRLTASRSISKLRYSGSLKNINSSYEGISTVMLRGFVKSNLQYTNVNNHNRNGSFGTKVSISVY